MKLYLILLYLFVPVAGVVLAMIIGLRRYATIKNNLDADIPPTFGLKAMMLLQIICPCCVYGFLMFVLLNLTDGSWQWRYSIQSLSPAA